MESNSDRSNITPETSHLHKEGKDEKIQIVSTSGASHVESSVIPNPDAIIEPLDSSSVIPASQQPQEQQECPPSVPFLTRCDLDSSVNSESPSFQLNKQLQTLHPQSLSEEVSSGSTKDVFGCMMTQLGGNSSQESCVGSFMMNRSSSPTHRFRYSQSTDSPRRHGVVHEFSTTRAQKDSYRSTQSYKSVATAMNLPGNRALTKHPQCSSEVKSGTGARCGLLSPGKMKTSLPPTMGFQTAGKGNTISVSEESMAKASKMFGEIGTGSAVNDVAVVQLSPGKSVSAPFGLFVPAGKGSTVDVSEDSSAKANKMGGIPVQRGDGLFTNATQHSTTTVWSQHRWWWWERSHIGWEYGCIGI